MSGHLFNRNFFLVAGGNFFLFLSFYALMPLLPFYLTEEYAADGTVVGLVLSCYMVSCIVIRPYCGYLLDTFNRRPIYILAYLIFSAVFSAYGATTTYIAVFADQNLIAGLGGWYFTCMAVGLALSRPFAGKKVDSGNIPMLVVFGIATATLVSISLFSLHLFHLSLRPGIFLTTAFIQGVGYGVMHPAFNTIFVRLTDEKHRGAATSMFFTSNDLGIGIGVLAGGDGLTIIRWILRNIRNRSNPVHNISGHFLV